jgi:cytochrome c-type biogenesis protein CcmE
MSKAGGRSRIGLIIAAVIILGSIGYMMAGGVSGNLVWFLTPSELLAKGPELVDAPIRLGGQVAPNSVKWDPETLDLRFTMQDTDGSQVEVHAKKAPPQMFREGIGVVVEGRYLSSGVFESTSLMVKHSNEYRAPEPGHDPKEMVKTLVREPAG